MKVTKLIEAVLVSVVASILAQKLINKLDELNTLRENQNEKSNIIGY